MIRRVVFSCLLGLGADASAASSTACSQDAADRADSIFRKQNVSWPQLSQHYREGICDDGYFAEGYSDLVVRLLANQWREFGALMAIAAKRPEFYGWVLRHIDETAAQDDLRRVLSNASSCIGHRRARPFCIAIAQAAEQALARSQIRTTTN
jgi:hypothetical protein